MEIPVSKVRLLLTTYGAKLRKSQDGKDLYKKGNVIIKIPDSGTLHYDHLEAIALEQLEIGAWEFDHFLGENGIV